MLLLSGMSFTCAQERSLDAYAVTVSAGAFERRATVVSFPVPVVPKADSYHLESSTGRSIPLQVGENEAWFILDSLRAGTERTYQIERGSTRERAAVTLRRRTRAIDISVGGDLVLRYWSEPRPVPRPSIDPIYERGGYLHPVRTPAGRTVTGDYPADHKHHHGIWSAWTRTEFRGRTPDFWNMGEGTGGVYTMALDSTWSGPVQAGLQARHRYVDRTGAEPVSALYETWILRVYRLPTQDSVGHYRMFDLHVQQTPASSSPLVLPEYRYGGVAVRGPDSWYGTDNARFRTSAGYDRSNGNKTRARWNYFGGTVEDDSVGIAMLGHPGNFRAPQPLRLPAEMPYFTFAPSQLGRWKISPGRSYEARYRFVTMDAGPDPELLNRIWNDYAYPPAVTVHRSN